MALYDNRDVELNDWWAPAPVLSPLSPYVQELWKPDSAVMWPEQEQDNSSGGHFNWSFTEGAAPPLDDVTTTQPLKPEEGIQAAFGDTGGVQEREERGAVRVTERVGCEEYGEGRGCEKIGGGGGSKPEVFGPVPGGHVPVHPRATFQEERGWSRYGARLRGGSGGGETQPRSRDYPHNPFALYTSLFFHPSFFLFCFLTTYLHYLPHKRTVRSVEHRVLAPNTCYGGILTTQPEESSGL